MFLKNFGFFVKDGAGACAGAGRNGDDDFYVQEYNARKLSQSRSNIARELYKDYLEGRAEINGLKEALREVREKLVGEEQENARIRREQRSKEVEGAAWKKEALELKEEVGRLKRKAANVKGINMELRGMINIEHFKLMKVGFFVFFLDFLVSFRII